MRTVSYSFDMGPIKPKDIKNILKKKSSGSSPGPDGITYGLLKLLPTTHHFMATLFNKVLESETPPSSWAESNVFLLHKKGDTSVSANFRMIALSSCTGKITNDLVNTEFQKAFLKGKNGCVEHNQVLHEIISHSQANNRTVHITWFDLEDAFGSVSHDLINLTQQRNLIPVEIQTYICYLYSTLRDQMTFKTQNRISDR